MTAIRRIAITTLLGVAFIAAWFAANALGSTWTGGQGL